MKLTRRSLAKFIAAGAAAAAPAPAQAPASTPEAEAIVAVARAGYRTASQTMAAVKLPRATEPATQFEA